MDSNEIRQRFLKFFEQRGHKIIPSASLVPENDPSVLFTTAGMQQFKPYYVGEKDALKDFGVKNVVTIQKCIRTSDIDEVGDDTHLTFFEMLGNFSFGGYWKKEAIGYAHEFITKELGLKIDYVSIFKDDESGIPADLESGEIWKSIDPTLTIKEHKKEDNFWGPTGQEGPCGPTTEIYINGVEIWNIVFNEFYKTRDGKYEPLQTKGIDTGMGLERLLVQMQGKNNVYETDLFNGEKTKEERVVADHVKAALFLTSDSVTPSNSGRGYILRRLIRRAVRFSKKPLSEEITKIKSIYQNTYTLDDRKEIEREETKFRETLSKGLKEFEKGVDPFVLFTTYGFPIELTLELAKEKGIEIDLENFNQKMAEHQKLSQTSSAGMFKGGLANHEEKTIRLHTAHHLLLAGLQEILGKDVKQKGSNITEERLRLDFLFSRKMTDEEKLKVEDWVNDKIKKGLTVTKREMPLVEAEKLGAEMEFGAKYGETVSVYFIEDEKGTVFSKEFCGGPHVSNTKELGNFKIQKEEAVAQGIRRIKAVLL
ncbi:alanine--tRNA ligase [Candidatus Nomurabacteria bacterium]|nr:alanine--tRNA ligase [Candidatus Nomurabacteria bacterium]